MKKVFYYLILLSLILVSCSNEEIESTQNVYVKVNPFGVISPFTYEEVKGELETFESKYKLRIRILAYNNKGLLKSQDTQYVDNYKSLSNSLLTLEEGIYKIIVVTDVVEFDGSNVKTEYWKMENANNIATLKLTDSGFVIGQYKILGVGVEDVTVRKDDNTICDVLPTPTGALCISKWMGLNTWMKNRKYNLEMSKSCDFIQFNKDGTWNVSEKNGNGEYLWNLDYVDEERFRTEKFDKNGFYQYFFVLPMNNVYFRYVFTEENKTEPLYGPTLIDIKNSGEYLFSIDLIDRGSQMQIVGYIGKLVN